MKQAMEQAWLDWHKDIEDPPEVNPSFKKGFEAGVEEMKRLLEDAIGDIDDLSKGV